MVLFSVLFSPPSLLVIERRFYGFIDHPSSPFLSTAELLGTVEKPLLMFGETLFSP
jgi:hypothetical protein